MNPPNPPMTSINIPNNEQKTRPKMIKKSLSLIPLDERTVKFYSKTYELKDDDISKSFSNLYENGLFYVDDQHLSLQMIFQKIAEEEHAPNAWTNKLFNLDLINEKEFKISKRKVSLESLKADTETSKTNKANVNAIISMLKKIKTHEDNFTLNYFVNNHRLIVLEILKFRLNNTKNLNTFKKDLDMMAWLFKNTFDEKNKTYKIYAVLISDLQMKYLKPLKI